MSDELVSVVMSTKDRCHLVGHAIESVLAQTTDRLRYELVVVDNNSSDDTPSVVRLLERSFRDVVRYVLERRDGVSHGRNAGIAASRGSIVAFIDDDVRVAPGWLSNAARLLRRNQRIQYLGGPVLPVWATEPPPWLTREHWSPLAVSDHGSTPFEVPTVRPICLISANLFIRRAALDRVGWFDPAFSRCQDRELMLRLWQAGLIGLYAPDVAAETIVPAERLTRSYHRHWHRTHGEFVSRMPLREHRVEGRWIVETSARGRFFLGAPLFEYRALVQHVAQWAHCHATSRPDEAFTHELRARYSLAFIRSSIQSQRTTWTRPTPNNTRQPPVSGRGAAATD
jgi:glycosyltransferase involved in cell wall biosynthesis